MQTLNDLDVLSSGAGDSTIVAIHGIQGTRSSWQPIAQSMSMDARWVLPNLRGRAAAWRGTTGADYALDAFAADMVRVIDKHVSTPDYVLAGWSMGVSVALATFVRLKQQGLPLPRTLILMSGSPILQQTKWFNAISHADLLLEIAARERRLGLQEAADHQAVAWTWQAIRSSDQRPLLKSVDVPTLIVHGSADEDSPWSHGQLLEQGLPQAHLSTIEAGRHSILTQNTAQVVDAMRKFLSQPSLVRSTHEKQ